MSAFGGKADIDWTGSNVRFWPKADIGRQLNRTITSHFQRPEAKTGQILISPRVLTKVENVVTVEPVGEFALKGIRRPMTAYNVLAASPSKPN